VSPGELQLKLVPEFSSDLINPSLRLLDQRPIIFPIAVLLGDAVAPNRLLVATQLLVLSKSLRDLIVAGSQKGRSTPRTHTAAATG